jgi:hypothetical protein
MNQIVFLHEARMRDSSEQTWGETEVYDDFKRASSLAATRAHKAAANVGQQT